MDILESLTVLHYVCQVCCLSPWRLGLQRQLERSRWLEFYGYVIISLATIYTIYGMFQEETSFNSKNGYLGAAVDYIQLVGVRVTHVMSLLDALLQRRSEAEFYMAIREIDHRIAATLNMATENERLRKWTFQLAGGMIIIFASSQLPIFVAHLLTPPYEFPYYWLLYLLPFLVCGMRYFQIYIALIIVRHRMDLLIRVLGEIQLGVSKFNSIKSVDGKVPPTTTTMMMMMTSTGSNVNSMKRLIAVRQIYQELWQLSGILNRCYGLSMLLLVGNDFLAITSNCYWIFLNFKRYSATILDILIIVGSAFWSAPHLIGVLMLALICDRTAHCSTKLALSLHRISVDLQNESHNALITQFSLQLLHQKLEFSAAGFFNIDCTLLYSIVGATTTYLIILIQFHMSEGNFAAV